MLELNQVDWIHFKANTYEKIENWFLGEKIFDFFNFSCLKYVNLQYSLLWQVAKHWISSLHKIKSAITPV